jgi:hypothetical protein
MNSVHGGKLHCFFCRGKKCKYENHEYWKEKHDTHPALEGVYSNWITDEIVATARPSSSKISEHKIIEQFKKFQKILHLLITPNSLNITSIINLQLPGEHAHCGDGLTSGGFSYNPEEFMRENSKIRLIMVSKKRNSILLQLRLARYDCSIYGYGSQHNACIGRDYIFGGQGSSSLSCRFGENRLSHMLFSGLLSRNKS